MDGGLAGLGLEHGAGHADDIADVELLEGCVLLLPDGVTRDIDLQDALAVLDLAEGSLAHDALDHQTARDGDRLALKRGKALDDLRAVMGHVVLRDQEGVSPLLLQRRQLVPADLQDLAQFLLGSGVHVRILTHFSFLL